MSDVQVVIVTDKATVAGSVKSELEALGYEVLTVAGTGKEAVQRATELQPDLVLMDVERESRYRDHLEELVRERTAELMRVNEQLEQEIAERARAEAEIQASAQRLLTVIETVGEGITLSDEHGYFEIFNSKMVELTGYTREQANACDDFLALLYPDPSEHRKASVGIQEIVQQGGYRDVETTIRSRDGSLKTLLVSTSVVRHQGRDWLLSAYRDITQRVQATEALRESEQKYRELADLLPQTVFEIDAEGNFVFSNRLGFESSGYTSQDLDRGLNALQLFVPEDRERVKENIRRTLNGEKLGANEYTALRKDGSTFPVIIYSNPVMQEGQAVGLRGIVIDITERVQAEDSLRRRLQQLTLLNDIGGRIAAVLDLDSVLERAARLVQERFGYHHVGLFTLDREREELVMRARAGAFAQLFPVDHRLKLDQGMVGWVARHGDKLLANDVSAEPRYVNLYPDVLPTQSELSVSIRVSKEIVGVLDIQSPHRDAFDENDVMVMETLADQIAVAIENARLYKALQESEARYRTLVEQIPAITYIAALDEFSTTLYVSPQVETYIGYPPETLEADPDMWRKRLHPDDYKRVMKQLAHSRISGVPFVAEYRMLAQDDRIVWFRDEAVIVRDNAGNPLCRQGIMFDITERMRAERDLQRAKTELENKNARLETLYRMGQIINSTLKPGAVLDHLTDEAMRVTRATHGQVLVVRQQEGHFERRSLRGFSPEQAQAASTLPLPLEQGVNGRAYTRRQAVCVDDVQTDDDYFPLIPTTRTELAVPIIRADRILGNLDLQSPHAGAFRDVDLDYLRALADQVAIALENARIFRAVEQGKRDWEVTFDAMKDAVALVDPDQRIARVNRAFADLVHYTFSEIVGQNLYAVLGGNGCPEPDCPLAETLESGQSAQCTHTYDDRFYEIQTTPISENSEGAPQSLACVVYVMHDITERVQAEKALRRTERLTAMGRLSAALAHEINNPLQAMRSNLELVLDFGLASDENEHYLNVCRQEIERLAEITQRVLSFSSPVRDTRQPVSFIYLTKRTLALIGRQLENARVRVTTELPADLPPVLVTPDQIVQVLLNVMLNATEVMPEGGWVRIAAREETKQVVLTLENNGPPIPPQHLEHIFDPFFTTKPDGTGLGLPISQSIVQEQGGTMQVENTDDGTGVRFTIALPIAHVTAEQETTT